MLNFTWVRCHDVYNSIVNGSAKQTVQVDLDVDSVKQTWLKIVTENLDEKHRDIYYTSLSNFL